MRRTLVIAEAGVNHNGSLDLALRMIDAAADAGADVVKFQTFRAELLASAFAPKAEYQDRAIGKSDSQVEMLRKLQIDRPFHEKLMDRCAARKIEFLSTPFDLASLELLVSLGVSRFKISSGDVGNLPLLRAIGRTGKPAILSSGMSTLGEVEASLGALASGYLRDGSSPAAAYRSEAGQRALRENVSILHCTTEYPTPPSDANLAAMDTLRAAFGLPVGYSDHTEGITVSIAAAARGATIVEKHFTLDRTLPGPDHQASLEPRELAAMVSAIRVVDQAIGDGRKVPAASELRNVAPARKSLVAATAIRRGEPFSKENLTVKRPGTGISPMRYDDLLGRPASRDYAPDELIDG